MSPDHEQVHRAWRMPDEWWARLQRLLPPGSSTRWGAIGPALMSVKPGRPCSSSGVPGVRGTR